MADNIYDGAIGIDLGKLIIRTRFAPSLFEMAIVLTECMSGTTYSCVATFEGGPVDISTLRRCMDPVRQKLIHMN